MADTMKVQKVNEIPTELEAKTLYLYSRGDGRSNAAVADSGAQRTAVFQRDIRLAGPRKIVRSQPGVPSQASYTIQNFSSFITYVAEVSDGSVSIADSVVTVTAPETIGVIYLKMNGEYSPIEIVESYVQSPNVIYPEVASTGILTTFSAQLSAFDLASGATDVCTNTLWQLSSQSDFSVLLTDLNLTGEERVLKFENLIPSTTYYLRAAYIGQTYGQSDWSVVRSFTTSSEVFQYIESQKLMLETATGFERFGAGVSIAGDGLRFLVGAPNAQSAGITEAFSLSQNWQLTETISDGAGEPSGAYGESISLDQAGLWAAVSVRQDDLNGLNSGSVLLYKHDGANWVEMQRLTSPSPLPGGNFGSAVKLSKDGNWLAVSERNASKGGVQRAGAVHLYGRIGDYWNFSQTLQSSDASEDSGFGDAATFILNTDYLLIGASKQVGASGAEGAVYLFENQSGSFLETDKIVSPTPQLGARFGFRIAADASGEQIAVSAPWTTTTVPAAGSVYLYTLTELGLELVTSLSHLDAEAYDYFGYGVAIDDAGQILACSVPGSGSSGAIALFTEAEYQWTFLTALYPSSGQDEQAFGTSLCMDAAANYILAGSPYDKTAGMDSGAVVVFKKL